jgi:uncharacterized protein YgiM (DUF1202 family)
MKKLFILAMIAVFLLSACAAEVQVEATQPPAQTAQATPDASLATPNVGSGTVRKLEGMRALRLYSRPDSQSAVTGQVAPGEKGKVLGLNATETWVLVQFSEQSGWVPVTVLALILAR